MDGDDDGQCQMMGLGGFLAWICSEIFNFTWFGFEKKKKKEKVFYTCMRVFFPSS